MSSTISSLTEYSLISILDFFSKDISLGYPASKLDGKVFYDDAPFLKDAPTLQTYVANPNNIGCHTFGTSENAFSGTQEIEREVLNVLATDVFKLDEFDGYIAPGGTEANIQAIWVFRNYFMHNFDAKLSEIVILASEDTHYSIPKASNLLQIEWIKVPNYIYVWMLITFVVIIQRYNCF